MRTGLWLLACVGCRVHFDDRIDAPVAGEGTPMDGCTAVPGLVAHYPMEPGDLAGSVLRDRSGNDHDGAIVGAPAPVLSTGHIGSALDFTATTTAYVEISGLTLDQTTGAAVTLTGWFHLASPLPPQGEVLFDIPPPPAARYDLWLSQGDLCVNGMGGECWGIGGAFLDRWVHVAVELVNGAETTSTMFVDGVPQILSCTQTPCDLTRTVMNPLRLTSGDTYQFHGLLDDVRLYDHALSPGEVAAVFAGTACN